MAKEDFRFTICKYTYMSINIHFVLINERKYIGLTFAVFANHEYADSKRLFSDAAYPTFNLSDVFITTDEVTCNIVGFRSHCLGLSSRM